MKISLNWLQDFVTLTEPEPDKIKAVITANTAEVETMESLGAKLGNVVVGEILSTEKHPDADKLNIAKIEVGEKQPRQIIFGQMVQMKVGDKVPVALAPTQLPTGMAIERRKMRGVTSEGMLCLEQELGLKEAGVSILYFPGVKPGTPIAQLIGMNDVVIDVDNHSLTNRSDLFSHRGFAREFVANGLAKWKKEKQEWEIPKNPNPPPIEVKIDDKSTCSRYSAVYLTRIKVAPSPDWIQKRLEAVGIRPINNIVDITNYAMMEWGMPLHAFDCDKLVGRNHVMRMSKKGEKVVTLDEKTHVLPDDVVILADEKEIYDLCGIMGGHQSSIGSSTHHVWLHAPIFNPVYVRRARHKLGAATQAAIMYEKGVYPELAMQGLTAAVKLILELCPGAQVASKVVDIQNKKPSARKLTLRQSQLDRLVGCQIKFKNVERILGTLGFEVKKVKGGYSVTVPHWRLNDIKLEADLIEEVARIHGYNNIPFASPVTEITPPPMNPRRELEKEVKDKLVALGFNEIYTFAFLGPELLRKCGMAPDSATIEIENPISSDISLMRQSLLPRMLETVEQTWRHEERFRLFELSKTYFKKGDASDERAALMMATAGENFRILQGVVEAMGLTVEHVTGPTDSPTHHPGRRAVLTVHGKPIGMLVEVHPQVLKAFDIKAPVTVAEVDLETIHAMKLERRIKFQELPRFPSVKLDVSIAIPQRELAAKYFDIIAKTDKTLIEHIDLVDEYAGDQLAADQRSLTYSITYRATDRTLTEEEVNKIHTQVITNLEANGAIVR